MTASVVFAVALIALVASGAVFRGGRLRGSLSGPAVNPSTEFDTARYRPMARLLSGDDFDFIESAQGIPPALAKRLRSERRRIFGRYLRNLEADFSRLHGAARELLLSAPEDRPDLAAAILTQHIAFRRAVWSIRLRLYMPGFAGATAEVGRLLDLTDAMRASLRLPAAAISETAGA